MWSSFVVGFAAWLYGFGFTYTLWGGFAVILGLFLFGIGVVPMGLVATGINGMWDAFWTIAVPGTRNGRICLIRSLVVRRLLTGGTEKGLSFSYSQEGARASDTLRHG